LAIFNAPVDGREVVDALVHPQIACHAAQVIQVLVFAWESAAMRRTSGCAAYV
jgi:hypothetical protein